MARGTPLIKLLDDLRAEIGASQNPAHNNQTRDKHIKLLQRTQDWLWEDHNWPHLRVKRMYPLEAGKRQYDFNGDFDLERIDLIQVYVDGGWRKLTNGITPADEIAFDSDLDERSYPPCKFEISEDNQIELHPISDTDGNTTTKEGMLRVTGIRRLKPLVADGDKADLDDSLIVLFAASELLGGKGAKDGSIKNSLAQKRYATLRGKLNKTDKIKMFGIGRAELPNRPAINSYRPAIQTDSD